MTVPFAFANLSGNIALSKLYSNFNTPITIGNTSVQLGNTVTTLNNITLANVNITSGNVVLTTAISANSGGTGLTSPGTAGNVLTSNGTAWVSSAVPGGGNGAPVAASYVLVSSNANLTSGRVLTAGGNVTITDNGPGNTIVINSSGGGGGGGGGLTLIATLTPTNGTSSISSTGLSSYKSILAITSGTSISGGNLRLSISSDNGSTYSSYMQTFTSVGANPAGFIQVYRTDSSSSDKPLFVVYPSQAATYSFSLSGVVNAVQVATSVGNTFTGTGSIYLYGMN
jgi:hypothetical protein